MRRFTHLKPLPRVSRAAARGRISVRWGGLLSSPHTPEERIFVSRRCRLVHRSATIPATFARGRSVGMLGLQLRFRYLILEALSQQPLLAPPLRSGFFRTCGLRRLGRAVLAPLPHIGSLFGASLAIRLSREPVPRSGFSSARDA
jgi:hypothetical protein